MNQQTKRPPAESAGPVKSIYRFDEQSLRQLRNKLPKPGVTAETSPLQAGFLLGVQHVLQMLQDGYTV
jgi:hypothetical protein